MLIKSPMQKTKVNPNKRKRKSSKRKSTRQTSSNGTVYGKRLKNNGKKKSTLSLPRVKPWKIIVGVLIAGVLGVLYLNHVFATQELLHKVQQMEREYNQAKRLHSHYKLTYDRMIGPAEIYDKAKNRGFINGGPAEKVITVQK